MYSKKHIIFDLDDTLIDSHQLNQQIFVDTFKPYVDVTESSADTYLRELHFKSKGTSMLSQFSEGLKHFSINVAPETLVKANETLHINKITDVILFNGVREMLRELQQQNKVISLCSNRQTQSIEKVLKKHIIYDYFSIIISCTDEGHEKPDPYCLNQLIAQSNVSKDAFLFFGDSKTDLDFANAAGIDSIIIDHYINQKNFYKLLIDAFIVHS